MARFAAGRNLAKLGDRRNVDRKMFNVIERGTIATLFLFCALATFLSLARPAGAQVNPGMPSFSAYDVHTADTINLQNLNILLNVPVYSKAGAMPINFGLQGDSYVYLNTPRNAWNPGILPTPLIGTVNGMVSQTGGTWAAPTTYTSALCPDGVTHTTKNGNWYLQTADGTRHWLPTSDYTDNTGSGSCYQSS